MSVPSLTSLPVEIVEAIIPHTLPEGFESLALACKAIHKLCAPFIKQHNHLRRHYRNFRYDRVGRHIASSFGLLERIAKEPQVARYVTNASLVDDNWPNAINNSFAMLGPWSWDPVNSLLANSSYLREAGLDWKRYSSRMDGEMDKERANPAYGCYSQHAAEFLLTLLPNVEVLELPNLWRPQDGTDGLLEAIVSKAQQLPSPKDSASLAQVTNVQIDRQLYSGRVGGNIQPYNLPDAVPFLALPRVKYFQGGNCMGVGQASMLLGSKPLYSCYGQSLECVDLEYACIDHESIAAFLRHTPRLKQLTYVHKTMGDGDNHDWDLCKFITAIEREVGSHLEELTIGVNKLRGRLLPGKPTLRGFQRLHTLLLGMEVISCNIDYADSLARSESTQRYDTPVLQPFIGDFLPASLSELWVGPEREAHTKMLQTVFSDFAAKRGSQLPNLKKIKCQLWFDAETMARESFPPLKKTCLEIGEEVKKAGIIWDLDYKSNFNYSDTDEDGLSD
ncbi:F-box domain protein [Xylariaceae sp. FL0804]|nr:F-box domain protein [Xylariaceae sp. FL0804]